MPLPFFEMKTFFNGSVTITSTLYLYTKAFVF